MKIVIKLIKKNVIIMSGLLIVPLFSAVSTSACSYVEHAPNALPASIVVDSPYPTEDGYNETSATTNKNRPYTYPIDTVYDSLTPADINIMAQVNN